MYLYTDLRTYLPTYPNLPAYLPTDLSTRICQSTYLTTYRNTDLPAHSPPTYLPNTHISEST